MPEDLAPGTPAEVVERAKAGPRAPAFDAKLGREVTVGDHGARKHRLVVIGDSLTHGFQSGAIYNTELSYGATVAHTLGWDGFRFPRYGGPGGGLPINIEFLLRELERHYGDKVDPWELPAAGLRVRALMDQIEDHWERGPGATPPPAGAINHALAVFGFDLRDALERTAERLERAIKAPKDDLFDQIVEHNRARAALRVLPAPGRRGEADDAARRGAGARRRRRDRDPGRLPRVQQRAGCRHRPQGQPGAATTTGTSRRSRLHRLAPDALRGRVRGAGRGRCAGSTRGT